MTEPPKEIIITVPSERDPDPVLSYRPIGKREDWPEFLAAIKGTEKELKQELLKKQSRKAVSEKGGNIAIGETREYYNQLVLTALGLQDEELSDIQIDFIPSFLFNLLNLSDEEERIISERGITELENTYLKRLMRTGISEEEAKSQIIEVEELVKKAVVAKAKGGQNG